MFSISNFITFRLFFVSISILFILHIFNDLDLNSQYFENVNADEVNNNGRIDLNYVFDSSEYFEEDNVPQNSNNNNLNNNYNHNNKNNQVKQPSSGENIYNQNQKEDSSSNNNNKNYEFTSKEDNNNNNDKDKSDYVTFNIRINLHNIEKEGFLRVVAYINGQSFNENIQLSELSSSRNIPYFRYLFFHL